MCSPCKPLGRTYVFAQRTYAFAQRTYAFAQHIITASAPY